MTSDFLIDKLSEYLRKGRLELPHDFKIELLKEISQDLEQKEWFNIEISNPNLIIIV